ncbi:DUF499 domain-containing protein [Paenibacillus sp. LHD-38]|uniref:DUF499 domain-containing protein n=1 Tax=Paenibacillus sp. LHD-38 TaxID=3072143 RepID=UPI00281088FF|nr:DUF499 domain-containing protein [Paenibacillus sp. LHD-38]MDQ8738735.1 DUF499 domain-containing protein [Paenibacillus sp. LHD-38]
MLGLQLREEFRNRVLKGTAIDFNQEVSGNKNAANFLEITYPSNDLLKAIEAVGPNQSRPVVMIGERGQGKSHLLTALYHTLDDPEATRKWLDKWSNQLNRAEISDIKLRSKTFIIAESLQRQNFKFLWDLILERHPHGSYIRGKWEGLGDKKTDVLGYDLLLELLKLQPTSIILDEFQTWYDALTNTKQFPWKYWAFNFIQNLTEIAKEYPELLVLVFSVRNGNSDAFQQIHRVNPVLVDFKGEYAKRDRKRLLLHRLFENRENVSSSEILENISVHLNEYNRLLEITESDREATQEDFVESWPFAPNFLQLLEDQVLIATDAQETRDLIKILANLYKQQNQSTRIITSASFSIQEERGGITALLDSVSNEYHSTLREKALRNLKAVWDAVNMEQAPHASNIISSLWLRSLTLDKLAGGERSILQVDITQDKRIDDNSFLVEMNTIVENSFNIHELGNKFVFRQEENPQSKLLSFARNNRIFSDGSDMEQLAKEIRYVLGGSEDVSRKYRVIVLRSDWQITPWDRLEESEHPSNWDNRIPIVVIPENCDEKDLGVWLCKHVTTKRNTVRYLLPRQGVENIFSRSSTNELIFFSRAILKANEWKQNEPEYKGLQQKYQKLLHDLIDTLFDKFAVLNIWNYSDPKKCEFVIEAHQAKGKNISESIDIMISRDIFIQEDFNELVEIMGQNNDPISKLLSELQEPRVGGKECIAWLGETEVKEKIIRLCAKGKIAIDLRGMEVLVRRVEESENEAWNRMKGKLGTGSHLSQTFIKLPSSIPSSSHINPAGGSTHGHNAGSQQGYTPTSIGGTGGTIITEEGNGLVGGNTDGGTGASWTPTTNIFKPEVESNIKHLETAATSSLNLIGKIEGWGINQITTVKEVTIKVDQLTGAQLQKLLRSLPDGVTYGLSLNKEEI